MELGATSAVVLLTVGATFGLFAALAFWATQRFSGNAPRAERRLDVLKKARKGKALTEASDDEVEDKKAQALAAVLGKAERFSSPLKPKSAHEEGKLKLRLMEAGFRNDNAVAVFLGVKVIFLMVGLLFGGVYGLVGFGFNTGGLIRLIVGGGIAFFIPEMILAFIRSKRRESIFLGLPDALDLMVVCVEAGLGLDQAMRKVAEEMKKSYRTIADEFGLCNLHLQMGRPRAQVLADLGRRSGVDDLKQLASILIQADKFGSSIAQALRVQSDSMRVRRRQLAEEKAAKTAVKLIFPLVLFIFPGIFVVLVGPAAITMAQKLL